MEISGPELKSPRSIRVLLSPAAGGAWNMAFDEALMGSAASGQLILRLYRWNPPTLSLGRNQRARDWYDIAAAARRGIDIVRRPTGGRAVYHDRELTYCVTAPATLWGGLRPSYQRINRALETGLRLLGVSGTRAAEAGLPGARAPVPSAQACFNEPLPGEITANGRKLVGSAQWRNGQALLQHGSLLIHDDQQVAEDLRLPREAKRRTVAAACLAGLIARVPSFEELAASLCAGFVAELGLPVHPDEPDERELERARVLEERYRSHEWTWRR